jgi:uncharacterized integral membrane protein
VTGFGRWVGLALKILLFLALFAFALRNTGVATVEFLFGYRWSAPLALILLAAFSLGALAGVLATLPFVSRARRAAAAAAVAPPAPAGADTQVPAAQAPAARAPAAADPGHGV